MRPSHRVVRSLALVLGLAACGGGPTPSARPGSSPRLSVPPAKGAGQPAFTAADASRALAESWAKEGVIPSSRADDATFLRRAFVDIVGTIPPADEVTAFVADASPDKRQRLVDRLLASPAYAEHFMNYWDDVLMGRDVRSQVVDRLAFRAWLRHVFAENTPWNRVVFELVTATGQNSDGGPKVRAPMAMPMPMVEATKDDEPAKTDGVNGAVNWTLKFQDAPQDLAGNASKTFLAVQIQCAQCHDHKSEKWKQDDFRKMTSAFLHFEADPIEKGTPKGQIRRIDLKDASRVPARYAKNAELAPIAKSKATALDGVDLEKGDGTRKALGAWMTSPENPWFAKAMVNRMWGHFLGRGFFDPVDDFRPSNEPMMPELLDALATEFVRSGYDVKALVRLITATEAYQLASSADAKTATGNKLWGKFRLVPLGPEELLNALFTSTKVAGVLAKGKPDAVPQLKLQLVKSFAFLFDVDEEFDAPDYEGTIAQALVLMNGNVTNLGSRGVPGTAVGEIVDREKKDDAIVKALYLQFLSRPATQPEVEKAVAYVAEAKKHPVPQAAPEDKLAKPMKGLVPAVRRNPRTLDPRRAAFEDLAWAMINSSEFLFNH